jgi:hypothetical protein
MRMGSAMTVGIVNTENTTVVDMQPSKKGNVASGVA